MPYGDIRLMEAAKLGFKRAIVPATLDSHGWCELQLQLMATCSVAKA